MDAGEVGKLVELVLLRDAELVGKFPGRGLANACSIRSAPRVSSYNLASSSHSPLTQLSRLLSLSTTSQRVRAASVGPHLGEGNLLVGALLEQELARLRMEEEDGEGAVEGGARVC